MSTVAGKRAACWATNRRVARRVGALTLCTGLACATAWFAPRCQAQSTAPQNNSTPPAPADDPPPSLIKHPKPPTAPPPQATAAPAPQSGSTPAPSEQPPAAQSGGTQTPVGQSGAAAAPSSPQNPGPGQSTTQTATKSTSVTSVSPTPAGVPSAIPAQPSNSGQPSTGAESPASQPATTPSASPASAVPVSDATTSTPEINTRTSTVPLESHANLVPVRVVVHDSTGHAVENLQKDDFQVKQDGKLQFITHFSAETPGGGQKQVARGEAIALPPDPTSYSLTDSTAGDAEKSGSGALTMPSRFVALLFDDAHLDVGDLTRSKVAALRFIDSSVQPNQRLAFVTVPGHNQVDFTDDHAKIREAITQLMASPVGAYDPATEHACLQMTYYQADLIQNKNDIQALTAATEDAVACNLAMGGAALPTPTQGTVAGTASQSNMTVQSTVALVLSAGETNTQYAVRRLTEVVRRVSALPGQRSIVLISPGFLTSTHEYEVSEVIDKANHANIFINTLDARGLYTVDPIGDITQDAPLRANAATTGLSLQYRITEQLQDSDLLSFVPSNLKNDGKFHTLSVKLVNKQKYTVQARRGFFAPKRGETPEQLAKQDIEDALFSQDEQQSLPIQMHLQYYKSDAQNAKLSVLSHVDLTHVNFEKSQGRNWDDLTIVAALFDRNGNFITGTEQTLELRLKDATLARLDQTGVTVKTNFDVKPGGYLVRLVVRDSKAAQLSARNGVVEIP